MFRRKCIKFYDIEIGNITFTNAEGKNCILQDDVLNVYFDVVPEVNHAMHRNVIGEVGEEVFEDDSNHGQEEENEEVVYEYRVLNVNVVDYPVAPQENNQEHRYNNNNDNIIPPNLNHQFYTGSKEQQL